jgi:hypothetical protein
LLIAGRDASSQSLLIKKLLRYAKHHGEPYTTTIQLARNIIAG